MGNVTLEPAKIVLRRSYAKNPRENAQKRGIQIDPYWGRYGPNENPDMDIMDIAYR
jgi:hypothetical protein